MHAAMDRLNITPPGISKQRSRSSELLDLLDEAIFEIDKHLCFVFINAKAELLLNQKSEALLGKKLLKKYPVLAGTSLHAAIDRAFKEKARTTEKFKFPLTNEEVSVKAIPSPGGVVVIIKDGISVENDESRTDRTGRTQSFEREQDYRIQLEKEVAKRTFELNESKHFIEQVTDTVPDIISVVEMSTGKMEYIGKNALLSHGFDYNEMKSMTIEEREHLYHSDDHVVLQEYYDSFYSLPDNHITTAEYRARNKEGKWLWFRARGKVFRRDEQGKPTHRLSVVQDITEQKLAEQALKQAYEALTLQQSLLQAAEKISQMGSWEKNFETGELMWSDGLYRIYDLEPGTIPLSSGFYIENFVHPDDRKKVRAHIRDIYQNFSEVPKEYRIQTPKGEKIVLSQPKIVYDENKKGKLFRGIVWDITAQKKAGEELIRLKLAQQKEILNAVLMAQERERERIGEGLHNGVGQLLYAVKIRNEMLEATNDSMKRQLKEINRMLDEAIAETRSISFQLVPGVLKEFGLEAALKSLFERMVKPGLQLSVTTSGLKKRLPENHEVSIYRIVQELVNNIIKHSKATSASLDITQHGEKIRLKIEDNGTGFDEKQASLMHKGIGLQSVKNRVKLLNTEMSIISAPSKGTKIIIDIPL